MIDKEKVESHTALCALGAIVRHHHREVTDAALIDAHLDMTDAAASWEDFARIAKLYKMKTEVLRPTAEELRHVPLPAMIRLKNGHYAMLGANSEDTVFISDPLQGKPVALAMPKFREVWSGEVLSIEPKLNWEEIRRRYNLDWFYDSILHYKKYFVEAMVGSFFLQLLGLGLPLFTQTVIDKVLGNQGMSTLTALGLAMVVICFLQAIINGIRTYILTHTMNKLDAVLGTRLFRHLVSLPVPYFEHETVGNVLMRIGMLGQIRQLLTGTTMTTLLDCFFSVVFIAFMMYYSVSLTLIAMVIIPLYALQGFWAFPIYWKKLKEQMRSVMAQRTFLVEAVTGMQTIKALTVEPQFLKRWENYLARVMRTNFDLATFNLVVNAGSTAIQQISNLCILWFGGYMVMNGEFTLGQLIAFRIISGQATGPIVRLLTLWPTLQQGFVALNAIASILQTRMEPVLLPPQREMPEMKGHIQVEDLQFRYRLDLPLAVNHVSFEILPGQKVALVGRSGSGKSTIAGLLQKLYYPEGGRIVLDGVPLENADYRWLRQHMGVVMQDNYLFDGSIRQNISAGRPTASMGEVMQAAQIAGAHDFILEDLDEGYDTRVGERGAGLSGGQRQRVAIARTLLANPRVLIFDEATSALDYESERIVMNNIQKIGGDRTMLIIAHRLRTVQHCDKIIVLDHGRVMEQGTHDELVAQGGIYARLWAQQEGTPVPALA